MITDNGQLASKFMENSPNFNGSLNKGPEQICANTNARLKFENTMKGVSIQQRIPLDKIVTQTLTSFPDALNAYVIAHGEIPIKNNPVRLALQAVLLRAKDVANGAKAIDTSDDDALMNIEQSEQGAQSDNTPDNETVLPMDLQAAMKIAMDYISDCHVQAGGDGSLTSALNDMETHAINKGYSTGMAEGANNADGDYMAADYGMDLGGDYIPSSATLPGLAPIPASGGTAVNPVSGMPTITANPAPTTNTSGIINTSTSDSGVLGAIGSILSGITQVAGQVTNAANAINNTTGAVRNTINNTGSGILSTYIQQHKISILLLVLGVIALIIAIVYLSKKSK